MTELVQNSGTSIFSPPIYFLFKTLTSLVFQGKKKPTTQNWILSIISLVASLFLAGTAWSFNRGSGKEHNTFRVCERPYLPSKWKFPDTLALFSYALKSLMRNYGLQPGLPRSLRESSQKRAGRMHSKVSWSCSLVTNDTEAWMEEKRGQKPQTA